MLKLWLFVLLTQNIEPTVYVYLPLHHMVFISFKSVKLHVVVNHFFFSKAVEGKTYFWINFKRVFETNVSSSNALNTKQKWCLKKYEDLHCKATNMPEYKAALDYFTTTLIKFSSILTPYKRTQKNNTRTYVNTFRQPSVIFSAMTFVMFAVFSI